MSGLAVALLAFRAEMNLSNRMRSTSSEPDAGTWQERVASGLYATADDHAVYFPDYLADVRTAVAWIGGPKAQLGYKLLAQAMYRKALCDEEVRVNGMDSVRSWVPSKTACPACVAAC